MTLNTDNGYDTLSRPSHRLKKALFFIVKSPILIPRWFFSFIVTLLAVNPAGAKKQHRLNAVFFTEDRNEKGIVVVNVCPPQSFKRFRDYIAKLKSVVMSILPQSLKKRRLYRFSKPKDKAYIDKVIAEVKTLLDGTSTVEKFKSKQFINGDIYLKGLEHLDQELRDYVLQQIPNTASSADVDIKFFTLQTPDDAVLDSVEVSTKGIALSIDQRKFIISCMPRDKNYLQFLKEFNTTILLSNAPTTIISCNYRGTDRSQGMIWTQDNMINDMLSQYYRLIGLGAKPENVLIEGHCLGASVATLVASRLHEQGQKVKLFNDRSFRSIRRLLVGLVLPTAKDRFWHPLTWAKCIAVAVMYAIVFPALWFTNWRMDAAAAWDKIPQDYKDYTVVRDPEHDKPIAQEDGLIHDSFASMASLMEEHQKSLTKKQVLTQEEQSILEDKTHKHHIKCRDDSPKSKPHWLGRRELQFDTQQTVQTHMIGLLTPGGI